MRFSILLAVAACATWLAGCRSQQPVRAGGIGFLWLQATPLTVAAGDSIILDFRLLQEVRPIICQ